jgi:uncharacterized protein (DUF39 family)
MSIHVVFLKKHDKYAAKSSHIVKRAVGKNLIGSGIAVPLTVYQRMVADELLEKAEKADTAIIDAADKKAAAEKVEAEKKAKAEKLLKAKSEVTIKKATSRKAKRRGKQVKK